ncbi:MAG: magnesium/cobalt transporter CorA [Anaerolineales bacterium]|nr:magnesium/cobalt transporter CorA [Anaerolineales bacterium]
MIRVLFQSSPRSTLQADYPVKKIAAALHNRKGVLWVDFEGEADATCEPILRDDFGFHPLAVDDALRETHTPKVDDWGEYVYIVLNALDFKTAQGDGSFHAHELDIFLGPNYVVTHHDDPIPGLDQAWQACQRDNRHVQGGPDHLLYKIMDYVVAAYMPIVEQIDSEIDELEDQIFDKPTPQTLADLFALKRILLAMRRVITPQREVLNRLARDDYRVIDPGDRIFFRDVYDHLVRLHDLNESMRDLVGGALDTYLSVINNRMNDVMKTLTIITTLFMPTTFIAGFFGMNFFLPDVPLTAWMQPAVFVLALGLILLIPIIMFLWMHRRTWI